MQYASGVPSSYGTPSGTASVTIGKIYKNGTAQQLQKCTN